jgi:hypothetical protein
MSIRHITDTKKKKKWILILIGSSWREEFYKDGFDSLSSQKKIDWGSGNFLFNLISRVFLFDQRKFLD